MIKKLLIMCLLMGAFAVHAVAPDEILDDPVMEAKAREISADLRCLVCQGESIDQSDSGFARDVRIIVREQLVAGGDRDDVIEFLVARYGEYILLKPRFQGNGTIVWLIGPILLVFGLFVVFMVWRQSKIKSRQAKPLSEDEIAELATLTGDARSGSDSA